MSATSTTTQVGTLQQVLNALSDPVRREMVRRLAEAGEARQCGTLYDGINKSTASHHFKTLREAGVIETSTSGGHTYQRLRLDDVEAALPGVLTSIVSAAES